MKLLLQPTRVPGSDASPVRELCDWDLSYLVLQEGNAIILELGREYELGRGTVTGIHDRVISRKQLRIQVDEDGKVEVECVSNLCRL